MDTIDQSNKGAEISPEELKEINSPVFKKSMVSFESIKNSILVNNVLENQERKDEHIEYAKLIMSPELHQVIGDENIKSMPLKRIHHFTHAFLKVEQKELHTIPCHILINEEITMEQISTFLKIRDIVSKNPTLVSILEDETGVDKQSTEYNINFANLILSDTKREAIGEEALISKNMSPEKIYTIEKRLDVEEINELGIWISHENMSVDKIILIGEMLSLDDVKHFGAEKLAEMSISDLQMELFA